MNDQIDSSIPVLTEIIPATSTVPPKEKSVTTQPLKQTVAPPIVPAVPQKATPPVQVWSTERKPELKLNETTVIQEKPSSPVKFNAETSQVQLSHDRSADEWHQLEQTIRENVLRQVLSRIDFVLEHRVRDSLAEVLQGAVDNLAFDIRAGLHQSLEEVITRAVNQELNKAKQAR